jgi:hypothetical protein
LDLAALISIKHITFFKLKQPSHLSCLLMFLTFENSNQIKLVQIGSNQIKLNQVGSNWFKLVQIGKKIKMNPIDHLDKTGSNWIKSDQLVPVGSTWFKMVQIGSNWF